MAKMTSAGLKTAMNTYVAAAKQAGAWTKSTNNFAGLLDKIGKTITIDGLYNDKLPELEGTELPLGKTIEEYFVDLTLPEAFGTLSAEGAKDVAPALPSVESVVYNMSLGREKIKTTVPYDNVERAFTNSEDAANALVKISEKLQNSFDLTRYYEKKQLLGNVASKVIAAKTTDNYKAIAIPTDTESAEAFITQLKSDAEDASFAHEGGIANALIGASPELVLFVKKGVMPVVAVKAMAGAFQKDELAIPARIKVVEDFGTITGESDGKKVFAILADPRGIKLHNGYNATRTSLNADGDFMNIVRHFEDTAFISKYTYVKVYEG